MITIEVLGTPAPKGSVRAFYKAGMKRAIIVKDNDKKQKSWDASVRDAALGEVGAVSEPIYIRKPLAVELVFRLARPSGHWKANGVGLKPSAPIAPATKPDADKLARATLDSLTGLVFDDDSRIVQLAITKEYAAPGREGATIVVSEWGVG